MKRFFTSLLAICLFLTGAIMANAEDSLTVIFNDGSSQIFRLDQPARNIKSIDFQGDIAASSSRRGAIVVVAGTYGKNCGASYGNKTDHLAQACNNKSNCVYTISYVTIGDPAVGCGKDYVAEWRCGGDERVHRTSVPPEAGFNKQITLSCPR